MKSHHSSRDVFPEGDWINIQDDLALMGWDHTHREAIRNYLKLGVPLSVAATQISNTIGSCPLRSQSLFNKPVF